jgi:hypothetical protein
LDVHFLVVYFLGLHKDLIVCDRDIVHNIDAAGNELVKDNMHDGPRSRINAEVTDDAMHFFAATQAKLLCELMMAYSTVLITIAQVGVVWAVWLVWSTSTTMQSRPLAGLRNYGYQADVSPCEEYGVELGEMPSSEVDSLYTGEQPKGVRGQELVIDL